MKTRTLIFAAGLLACIAIIVVLSFKNNQSDDKIKEVSLNARDRGVYFPNSEDLAPDEMRIVSLGTGMPYGRRAQAATSWLVELGNGDKFLFDVGTGSVANLGSMEIPYDFLNKVFLSHLHTDHMGDLPALYVGGVVGGRTLPFHVWGPSGSEERLGLSYAMKHLQEFVAWDLEGRKGRLPTQAFNLITHEFDFKEENHIVYEENGVTIRAWPAPTPFPISPVDTKGMKNVSPEIQAGTFDVVAENQMIYDRVNKKYGTNLEPRVK